MDRCKFAFPFTSLSSRAPSGRGAEFTIRPEEKKEHYVNQPRKAAGGSDQNGSFEAPVEIEQTASRSHRASAGNQPQSHTAKAVFNGKEALP